MESCNATDRFTQKQFQGKKFYDRIRVFSLGSFQSWIRIQLDTSISLIHKYSFHFYNVFDYKMVDIVSDVEIENSFVNTSHLQLIFNNTTANSTDFDLKSKNTTTYSISYIVGIQSCLGLVPNFIVLFLIFQRKRRR
jgi:hypothetical protein